MRYGWIVIACFLVAACNPVKQVLRSSDKTEQVVQHYLEYHNIRSGRDTLIRNIPGEVIIDTVYKQTAGRDSLVHDTIGIHHYFMDTVYIRRTRVDTMKITVYTNEFSDALQIANAGLTVQLKEARVQTKQWKTYALWTWGILLLMVVVWIIAKLTRRKV